MKSRSFYDVQHYVNLKSFTLQGNSAAMKGMRSMNRFAVLGMLLAYAGLAAVLTQYLYTLAVTTEVAGEKPTGGMSGLFWSSLGGAAIALPLILLIVWMLRNIFVQPVMTYILMFLHGSTFAVWASLITSSYAPALYQSAISHTQTESLSFFATVHAPFFEELFKGVGIIVMLLFFRNFIRTPQDGAIYGMLLGFGFAFTENIQYFIQYGGSSENFWTLLISRVFASLLTHATFTAAIGLLTAYFYSRYGTFWRGIQGWVYGFAVAAALHALWNGSSSVGLFIPSYLFIFLPLFLGISMMMKKSAQFYDRSFVPVLDEYAAAGWLDHVDYQPLFPKQVRTRSFRRYSKTEKRAARRLASALSELTYVRISLRKSPKPSALQSREREILLGLALHQEVVHRQDHQNPDDHTAQARR